MVIIKIWWVFRNFIKKVVYFFKSLFDKYFISDMCWYQVLKILIFYFCRQLISIIRFLLGSSTFTFFFSKRFIYFYAWMTRIVNDIYFYFKVCVIFSMLNIMILSIEFYYAFFLNSIICVKLKHQIRLFHS